MSLAYFIVKPLFSQFSTSVNYAVILLNVQTQNGDALPSTADCWMRPDTSFPGLPPCTCIEAKSLFIPRDRWAAHPRRDSFMQTGVTLQICMLLSVLPLQAVWKHSSLKSRSANWKNQIEQLMRAESFAIYKVPDFRWLPVICSLSEALVITVVPILQIWGTDTQRPPWLPPRVLQDPWFVLLRENSQQALCLKSKQTPDKGHSKYISFL
jgi:hypothetical protein